MNERRQAAAHVFVADLAQPVLSEEDMYHLSKVLRLRGGEVVSTSDGRGSWRMCQYRQSTILDIEASEIREAPQQLRELTVAFAVTKGDKPDLVVQKLTELGIEHIVPLITERCIVRWDEDKGSKNQIRWQKIAREAAMQSRSVTIPQVHKVFLSLEAFVASQGADVAFAEPGGQSIDSAISVIVIGPEGGFTHQELALSQQRVSLPGGILRSETAAVAAAVLMSQQRVQHG